MPAPKSDVELVLAWAEELGCMPARDPICRRFRWGATRAKRALTEAREQSSLEPCHRVNVNSRRSGRRTTFKRDGARATFEATMMELGDPEEILEGAGIDTRKWRIKEVRISNYEGWRKDEEKDLTFKKGVASGYARDRGGIYTKNLVSISMKLELRRDVIKLDMIAAEAIAAIKAEAMPIDFPAIITPPGDLLLELAVPDAHFGKLAWALETGESNYDLKAAERAWHTAIQDALGKLQPYFDAGFGVEQVVFPVGNDLLHVDGPDGATTKGTRQDVDSRWQKALGVALRSVHWAIDHLATYGPVRVISVPGNHAEVLEAAIGFALAGRYELSDRVVVDHPPIPYKRFRFGKLLLGFCHGHESEPLGLPQLMARLWPKEWERSKRREWHIGHRHQRGKTTSIVKDLEEDKGVSIRVIPSLCPADAWHARRGFLGGVRACEAFLWDRSGGLVAHVEGEPGQSATR